MKHYLDLIPIRAKQNRRQTRMTRLCILLAVFLVTVIFGMADMEMRAQRIQAKQDYGSWHAGFQVNEEQASMIAARPEVKTIVPYGVINYNLLEGYKVEGVETAICGFDEELLELFPAVEIVDGTFPQNAGEIVINEGAHLRLGLEKGDAVFLDSPDGRRMEYKISGFSKDSSMEAKNNSFGMFLNVEGYSELESGEEDGTVKMIYYVEFTPFCNIQKTIDDICTQFELKEGQFSKNVKLLALIFQTRDSNMIQFYMAAAVLSVIVTVAGIFMIAASLNSNIAGNTEFFGMLRCLGATRKQIVRFVQREALGWCRTAIPTGVAIGVVVIWGLCAMLKWLSPAYFDGMQVFGISWIGGIMGILVGLLTVLIAARSPAKKASMVTPLEAVSGNAGTVQEAKKAANTRIFKIETALGIHHATGSKRNFFLMVGSFAFSMILFLSFSTEIDFMNHAIVPLQPYSPDLYISSPDQSCSISKELAKDLKENPHVKKVFGRGYLPEMDAVFDGKSMKINLISYENYQFRWAEEMLVEGSLKDVEEGKAVLAVHLEGDSVSVENSIRIRTDDGYRELPVAGVVANCPYADRTDKRTFLCSEKLFEELTGEREYSVIDIQLTNTATDQDVENIRRTAGEENIFSDRRINNREAKGAYYSFAVFLYGFLAVIALISVFNIINSIGMSVSARMREYGAMRAVGMSEAQVFKMISGEAVTYAICGIFVGGMIGLPLNYILFNYLVTSHWGDAWQIPGKEILVIMAVILCSLGIAVRGPAKRIRRMSVVETISIR